MAGSSDRSPLHGSIPGDVSQPAENLVPAVEAVRVANDSIRTPPLRVANDMKASPFSLVSSSLNRLREVNRFVDARSSKPCVVIEKAGRKDHASSRGTERWLKGVGSRSV